MAQTQTAVAAVVSVVVAAAQEENSKALPAAYDGRLWVQVQRSGVQCCWDVQYCVTGQEG